MARPLRMLEPNRLYFVTNRTLQARLLLRPSPYVNNLIGGVLAHALERFSVRLFAFCFLSNHFHMILDAPDGQLSDFLAYVESKLAREIGRHVGWREKFWARRFSAEPILDDDALLRCVRYIFAHGVKEGLVDRPQQWPGLTCIPELVHGITRSFPWFDRSAQHLARLRGLPCAEQTFASYAALRLTPLPCWVDLTNEQRLVAARELLDTAEADARLARGHKPVLGPEAVLAQDPHSAPEQPKRTPRPLCHASSKDTFLAFRAAYRAFVDAFRRASACLRKGDTDVLLPKGCFGPPIPFGWPARREGRVLGPAVAGATL